MKAKYITEEWVDDLRKESEYCRNAQSWAPGSTRTQWADELAPLLKAAEGALQFEKLLEEAEEFQYQLTEKVALRLADFYTLQERILQGEDDDAIRAEIEQCDSLSQLVECLRFHSIVINDETNGIRDGYVIDSQTAECYATCRGFSPEEDLNCVNIDLLTGDIKRW